MIAMVVVLATTLSQCKKEEPTINNNEKVSITLDVNSGERNIIHPETGEALFESGDVVYVANDGHYVGTLTYNQGLFSGDIATPSENDYLHFYFMGNKTPEETLYSSTTTLTVNISDQTNGYPEIAYAPSTVKYSSTVSAYHARLLNKCALVKFNVATSSSSATYITGMNNKVSVDLGSQEFSYEKSGTGIIKLGAGNGEKWAILLPQTAIEGGELGSAYSGNYRGTRGMVPTISENGYLATGIDVTINTLIPTPTGAINGLFTINENCEQVYFSQGNLQYIGSVATPYWKFADHQWDYFGSTTGQNSSDVNVDRDLFGWGTSGWDNGNTYYQPWDTDNSSGSLYGPPVPNYFDPNSHDYRYGLTGSYANSDWGVYNPISNGGNQPNQWRTLTIYEWRYIFDSRSTSFGIRYAKAQVNNVKGLILLPDDWNASYYTLNNINEGNADFSSNIITATEWIILEQHGAVLLPVAGSRSGTTMANEGGTIGGYWPATGFKRMPVVFFSSDGVSCTTFANACTGLSVRLVQDY